MTWHLLQISDALDVEFGSALAESVPVIGWQPERSLLPWGGREWEEHRPHPPLRVRHFPLHRGYARPAVSRIFNIGRPLVQRMARQCESPSKSPLICTTPYLAPVARRWPGPVVYWLTDRIASYAGADAELVRGLDRSVCESADLVCPNSLRLSEYLIDECGCDPAKIQVLPNATRASNLLPAPLFKPAELPADLAGLPRPVAGVIGNLAGNMDWVLLEQLVAQTPGFSWAFVGPSTMEIPGETQRTARARVMAHPTAKFTGKKQYGELASYARCFDVAVLPYLRQEPTYSGSSTRFYEHLAATRPMIATRGFEELLRKEPLVQLVNSAAEAAAALAELQAADFQDGWTEDRWRASLDGTWQARALTMQQALAERLPTVCRDAQSR